MTPQAAALNAIMYININTSSGYLLPNYTLVNGGGTYGLQPAVNYDLSEGHDNDYGDSEMSSFYYKDDIEQLKKPWVREPHFIPLTLIYGFVFIVGITGNSLVIAVLCLGRAGRCVTFPCLVSMAWADVLFLMVCVPHEIVIHFISHWTLSDFMCKMSGFVENLSANATVLNLILISIERYLVISHPLSSKTMCTSRNARIALACTWITAILLACPSFVVMGTESNRYYNNSTSVVVVLCADLGVGTEERLSYAMWQLVGLFLLPTCILLYCYIRVICILWLSARQLQALTSPNRFDPSRSENCTHAAHRNGSLHWRARCSPSFRAGEEALQKRKQVIKMLIIIIVVFLLCWGPKLVVQVMKKFHLSFLYTRPAFISIMVISCLPYLQSCINPIIYVLMSKNIRTSIRQIACSRCPCKCFSEHQWTESISHELIKTNHSQGASSMETYRSFRGHRSTTAHF